MTPWTRFKIHLSRLIWTRACYTAPCMEHCSTGTRSRVTHRMQVSACMHNHTWITSLSLSLSLSHPSLSVRSWRLQWECCSRRHPDPDTARVCVHGALHGHIVGMFAILAALAGPPPEKYCHLAFWNAALLNDFALRLYPLNVLSTLCNIKRTPCSCSPCSSFPFDSMAKGV